MTDIYVDASAKEYCIAKNTGEVIKGNLPSGLRNTGEKEYYAMYKGLLEADDKDRVFSDSQMIVKHLNGDFRVKSGRLRLWFNKCLDIRYWNRNIEIIWIPRRKNFAGTFLG